MQRKAQAYGIQKFGNREKMASLRRGIVTSEAVTGDTEL